MSKHATASSLLAVVWLCALPKSGHASNGWSVTLETCGPTNGNGSTAAQMWGFTALPGNLPSPQPNASQVVTTSKNLTFCPSSGGARCCLNVEAWGTKKGNQVWVTVCSSEEPVEHERNRVWVPRADGSLYNPTSGLCVDAEKGSSASPGDKLVLADCDSPSASRWVYSQVDGSISQANHAGHYPGLCMTAIGPQPPAPSPPLPPKVDATIDLNAATSNSTSAAEMVSFNFDWHEDHEEAPLWINMSANVLDLENPMLRTAAKAMSPARLRIGGSEGDVLCYDVPTYNSTCESMNQTDSLMCLKMDRFEQIAKFASDTGLKLVFGLNAVWGREGHQLSNPLDMTNIEALLRYAAEKQVPLYGVELGNEKCGPPPDVFAADYKNLQSLLRSIWPGKANADRPLLIGNDCNTNPKYLSEWLPLLNDSVLDVVTYHRYVGYGLDPKLETEIVTPKYLDKVLDTDIVDVKTQYAPSAELWVGEGAAAWHSGRANVTNAWASCFWWSEALGHLAQYNHTGYCRQTLVGGSYGLINRTNFEPNPDYYLGLLYKRLMGDTVLRPELSLSDDAANGWLRAYAQCARGGSGVALMVSNIAENTTFTLSFSNQKSMLPRDEYVLTGENLEARYIELNGETLGVSDGALPELKPKKGESSNISVAPRSISIFVFPDADAPACAKQAV